MTRENNYFEWLTTYGGVNLNASKKYYLLLKRLYHRPFMAKHSYDQNRIYEARSLRDEFVHIYGPGANFPNMECSMLELLISLAIRGADYTDREDMNIYYWFWDMLSNLDLSRMSDPLYVTYGGNHTVDCTTENLNLRLYKRDGSGGLFPLKYSKVDQRKVELWYQMCAYIEENDL